jgi:potassium-transporting ATPase KdpC subunit
MKKYILPSLKITLLTLILFGVVYPLAITGFAKLFGANQGNGKTVTVDGKVVGFEIIGQRFASEKYFNSRPSAVNYNAASTGGSNKGPSNPDYLKQVEERVQEFLKQNPRVKREDIPVDLLTASGGGLDPHISVQAAYIQADRIARVRGVDSEKVTTLINQHIQKPLGGFLGTTTVNVLQLNIELDKLK